MNQDEMAQEMDRLMEQIKACEPGSEKQVQLWKVYEIVQKLFHASLEACEEDLNNRQARELNERKQSAAEIEMRNRVRMAKIEALVGLGKVLLTGVFTLAAIVLTGALEETTILSSKCLAWIKNLKL